jgi:hypothetical protein
MVRPSFAPIQSNQVKLSFCIIILLINKGLEYALPHNDMKLANLVFLFPGECGQEELQQQSFRDTP